MKRSVISVLLLVTLLISVFAFAGCSLVETVEEPTGTATESTAAAGTTPATENKTTATKATEGETTAAATEAGPAPDATDVLEFSGPTWWTYAIEGVKEEYRDSLTVLVLPDTYGEENYPVTDLRSDALANCSNLTSVSIPASIESIGSGVFSGCRKLTEIKIYGTSPSGLTLPEQGAFEGAAPSLKVFVPRGTLTVYNSSYEWMNYRSLLEEFDPE
ncbi:MAG: leucine-rich repeat protein [Clostridia bacterium]|nr:leucine-rich repeat protein [Clostridia bacterium]